MNNNPIFGIVAVNQIYIDRTKNLINQMLPLVNNNFIVLTNDPSQFYYSPRISTIPYDITPFSFHDKRLIFEKGFELSECVILLDADHAIREKNTLSEIKDMNVEPGLYPQILWKHPAHCSFENFIEGKNDRVPYGREFKEFCYNKGWAIDNCVLIQESFLIFKKHNNINVFLNVWKQLANFCETKDLERKQSILGYGEGYSIGVAVRNSGLSIIEHHPLMHSLAKDMKHFAWER